MIIDDDSIINAAKEFEKSTSFDSIVLKAKGVNSAAGIGFLEGAAWARKQIMEDAVKATIDWPVRWYDFPNIYPNYKDLKEYCNRHSINDNDKVKIAIVKENKL